MSVLKRALVASIIALAAIPSAGFAHPRLSRESFRQDSTAPKKVKLPADYAAWARVAGCESNSNWEILGAVYPDPLGITAANWAYYGRKRFGHAPAPEPPTSSASIAERVEAIQVGDEILRLTGAPMPDQHGCQYGGW